MNIKIAKKIVFGFILVGITCFLNAEEVAQNMPPLEKSFIKIMNKALDEYSSTTNEVKKTKIRIDLEESLSNLLKDRVAKDWVGAVVAIRPNDPDGSARITVLLPLETTETTGGKLVFVLSIPNKAADDDLHIHTGIDIGSDLYSAVSELEAGDGVVFSGRFVSLSPDTVMTDIFENELGRYGAIFFKFTSVKKSKYMIREIERRTKK